MRSGSTKAFLSEFGASIAPEVKSHGIDVCVLHPSPTASNFYDSKHVTHTIDAMDFFKKTGCASSSRMLYWNPGLIMISDQISNAPEQVVRRRLLGQLLLLSVG